ncbi:hypothetical protein AFK68_31750 [Hydrocoleum sp. CS-953]|uniref:hypothetical protein n=1 Tax=Hydrocoleum sp. CS-953 TaxID=1671698 RepID=UPI000BCF2BD4|nr:hypothetical protein [Hydrocoleum sp. CS-953]OZH51326.1 hypothetical protein AFK68_31750 [Hydrocoleum sp. CS-953]
MIFPNLQSRTVLTRGNYQLSIINYQLMNHDWENEDRPPVVSYQPYVSAYQAIQNLKENSDTQIPETAILCSALNFSFRLPPVIR